MILHAGPIQMLYESGFLRYIKYGETEILRMIYFALRDENWATLSCNIEQEKADIQAGHYTIEYDGYHEKDGKRIFYWQVKISGSPDGSLEFVIRGKALSDLLKNRAGFCVLHPVSAAGQPCEIKHPSGPVSNHSFPDHIDPENPFQLIQGFQWKAGDHWYSLDFEGDLFETEDQRNWSDASFKTFCTPLSLPFPVKLHAGETICQKVHFKPNEVLEALPAADPTIEIRPTHRRFRTPWIGTGASTEIETLRAKTLSEIRSLPLEHYRFEMNLFEPEWMTDGLREYKNSVLLGLLPYIALHLTGPCKHQTERFITWCLHHRIQPEYILLLSEGHPVTAPEAIDCIPMIRAACPDAKIGAGTDFNFTEINRNRMEVSSLDFVSFSVNPQVHAFDDRTLIENIGSLQAQILSAKNKFGENMAIHVSPLTLRMRVNPNATDPSKRKYSNEIKADPRQKTFLGAAYALGSLKALTLGGCEAVTLFQSAGNQGLLPEEGEAYPVYHALKMWLESCGELLETLSSHPLILEAIVLEKNGIKKLILINYASSSHVARFEGSVFELSPQEIRILDLH